MKTSLRWLNDYLDRPATPDEVEQLMTAQGMPVETRVDVPGPGGGDVMVDVEVTSNRSDCLSHFGVAREVGAGSGRALKSPVNDLTGFELGPAVNTHTSITVEPAVGELCPLYTARVIQGVKVGPSPAWLVQRLEAVGLRSVNNVVDITNFVLMELGQPLHAFDMARLAGRKIVVRTARENEEFLAIDGSKHKLAPSMLVIADEARPVAVAGIMGGKESEVDATTTDILLESAVFAPGNVRRTARALRLSSDSSYRFERGVDIAGVERASRRAARLILEVAGGTLATGVLRHGIADPEPKTILLRAARCRQLLGIDLSMPRMVELLTRLGLSPRVEAGDIIACTCPSHRLDLSREVDLIEEVVRLEGLDKIGVDDRIKINVRAAMPAVEARRKLAQALVANGFHETISFSFVKPKQGDVFLEKGKAAVVIEDERRKTEPMLRPSILPSLMNCRRVNHDAGVHGVRLFEVASVWVRQPALPAGEKGEIIETRKLGLLADAASASDGLRDMRGVLDETIATLAGSQPRYESANIEGFAAAARVFVGDKELGLLGVVGPSTIKAFEAQGSSPIIVAELNVEPLIALYPPQRSLRPLARFPAIERDLSVVVDEATTWEQIHGEVVAAQPALLEETAFLVTYRGKPMTQGQKSVSFRMLFRDPAGTLRHDQVDGQVNAVTARLREKLKAELRA